MILGILSDTHDSVENTRRVLNIFKKNQVDQIIHCGDITIPRVVQLFDGWRITFVFGNLDRGHTDLSAAVRQLTGKASIAHRYAGALEGVQVTAYHGTDDEYLASLISDGQFDYVFHGHTHLRRDEMIGHTRVINPGSVGGRRKETRSVCVLSLPDGTAKFVEFFGE